jgi:hypothetical protein
MIRLIVDAVRSQEQLPARDNGCRRRLSGQDGV